MKTLEVTVIAQICYAGVTALREAMTKEQQPEWDALNPEDQGRIVDYIVMVLTGRSTPDNPEGEVIRKICNVLRSEKKSLKYA
jgi:methyl coenzyme M reductase subunit C